MSIENLHKRNFNFKFPPTNPPKMSSTHSIASFAAFTRELGACGIDMRKGAAEVEERKRDEMVKSIRVNLEDISCSSSSLSPPRHWLSFASFSLRLLCCWLQRRFTVFGCKSQLEKRKTSTEQTRESSAQKVALLSVRVSSQNIESRVSRAGLCAKHCTTRKRD